LNFFGLYGECVCIHCSDCSFVSAFANETQVSSPITSRRSQRQSILCVLRTPMSIFITHLAQNL
jgi:hypothetical protein